MALVLKLEELQGYYLRVVRSLQCTGTLTLDKGIDLALQLYQEVKVAEVSTEEVDADRLLFQYGIQDWGTEKGRYFGLDFTRQLTVVDKGEEGEEDELLLYQLRYEFEFEPTPFEACKSYNSWSASESSLWAWVAAQRETPGFQLACTNPFRRLEIALYEV